MKAEHARAAAFDPQDPHHPDDDFPQAEAEAPPHPDVRSETQDVLFGMAHAFYGITAEWSPWADPALHGFQRAYWIRSFVHFVGDVHQPLHSATGCSAAHPKGDFGGNAFKIKTKIHNKFHGHDTSVAELHLLWDLCGGTYAAGPNWPMNATQDAFLASEAKRLIAELESDPDAPIARKDIVAEVRRPGTPVGAYFTKIRDESHDAAESVAYKGITENAEVTDAYLASVVSMSARRVALGGFRLQGFLERMYDTIHHSDEKVTKDKNTGATEQVVFA